MHAIGMLRAFENVLLRRIFGPKRAEVTREWRKLHNEKLHGLYSSPNMIGLTNKEELDGSGM